ncbi:MAG: NADH-quinone oxidoreductase subunit C, partial [Casimicrobiaceae bacterium]
MNVAPLGLAAAALPAGVPAQRAQVSSGQLLTACRLAWENDGRLIALWASDERDRRRGFCVRVVLEDRDGLTVLEHTLPDADARYPDLSPIFPAANRMQRATYDLLGV